MSTDSAGNTQQGGQMEGTEANRDRTTDNRKSASNANDGNYGNPNTGDAKDTKDAAGVPEADTSKR